MSTYVPKPDLENVNSSETHPWKEFSILVVGAFAVLGLIFGGLLWVADFTVSRISLEREISWFSKFYEVAPAEKISPEFSRLQDQLQDLAGWPLKISLSCSDEVNAFALPGARIVINQGLLEKLQSVNGLVFVLGHEMGHIHHRDHLRGMTLAAGWALTQAIFGMGSGFDGGSSGFLSGFGQAFQTRFGVGQEEKADEFALVLQKKFFGHTQGADELFAALEKDSTTAGRWVERWLSTHPETSQRLQKIRAEKTGGDLEIPVEGFKTWKCEKGWII